MTSLLWACGGGQAPIPPIPAIAQSDSQSNESLDEARAFRFEPSTTMTLLDTACGPVGDETCDGVDNDCDGEFDEGCFTAGPMLLVISTTRGGRLSVRSEGAEADSANFEFHSPEPHVPCADDAPIVRVLIPIEAPSPSRLSASSTCADAHLSFVVLERGQSLGAFAGPIGTESTSLGELVTTSAP